MISLRLGYVPLIDAALLIVAQELGFAAEEGLALDLVRLGAWAQACDMLGAGLIDAAHMLVPMPVGQALGLGPELPAMDLVMVLSQGGQAVAVNRNLETRLRGAVTGRLRMGVPFGPAFQGGCRPGLYSGRCSLAA